MEQPKRSITLATSISPYFDPGRSSYVCRRAADQATPSGK
jgi:hypothetical protein